MAVEQFELGEVGERAGQAVDLVNDNDINLSSFDVGQEPLQGRVVGRASGIAPVIVAGPDQGPAGMGLAADIGLRGIMLGVERVKVLLKPVVGLNSAWATISIYLSGFVRARRCSGQRSRMLIGTL